MKEQSDKYDRYQQLIADQMARLDTIHDEIADNAAESEKIKKQLEHAFANNNESEIASFKQKSCELKADLEFLVIEKAAIEDVSLNEKLVEARRDAYSESFDVLAKGRQIFESYRDLFSELSDKWLLLVQELHDVMNRYNCYKHRCDNLWSDNMKRYHESVGAYVVPRLHNEFFFMDNKGIEQIFTGQRRFKIEDDENE